MAIPVRKTVELYCIDFVIICSVVIIEKSRGHHVKGPVNIMNAGGKNNKSASHGKHVVNILKGSGDVEYVFNYTDINNDIKSMFQMLRKFASVKIINNVSAFIVGEVQ
jgi:hypothetical protein